MSELLRQPKVIRTYLIEVEGEIPSHRAVEAGFQVGCPAVTESVRSSTVVLADTRHSRIHCLQTNRTTGHSVHIHCLQTNRTTNRNIKSQGENLYNLDNRIIRQYGNHTPY
jgi:hypothetical protein